MFSTFVYTRKIISLEMEKNKFQDRTLGYIVNWLNWTDLFIEEKNYKLKTKW